MPLPGDERRKHERRPVNLQVRYRAIDTFFYDYALNISHGGIFIRTVKPLARGSEVEVEFDVPGAPQKIRTRGKVARVVFPSDDDMEPAGMGIEFKKLSEEDKALIDALWQQLSRGKKGEAPHP